jgi:hypothetical protein
VEIRERTKARDHRMFAEQLEKAVEHASATWRENCNMQDLEELKERRAYECRLTPDRALATIDEAEQFLCDRGLLTRTADSALPSLFQACHEDPYSATSPGFGQWPATKWPWFGEVAERGYLVLSVHSGKNLLVAEEIAALLDPICRAEIERMHEADPDWARLLDHLAEAGPSNIGDLQVELTLRPKQLKALRAPLERCGAVVSRSLKVTAGHGHSHTSELARWDQVHPSSGAIDPRPRHSLANLLVAAVRAAVFAPERELKRWFSWQWYWDDAIVDELVTERQLVRVDGHVTAAGAPS